MSAAAKRHQTQWTAQFLAAAELMRRGYLVSFTLGNNTPEADLMVTSPAGCHFRVDVKGLSSSGGWWVRKGPRNLRDDLFYILVLVGKDRARDQFFVLSAMQTEALIQEYLAAKPRSPGDEGFQRSAPQPYRDRWTETLPP